MGQEESLIENLIKAVEGTKSSADLVMEDVQIKLPWVNAAFTISGKISFTARPIHERQ
ncbi:MAG: hypothetical protein M1593_02465 [Candidatus Thermoplasmatota archaeon]|jgi:hypothetical protein|nr:hypothetical protein [Candidatus Thermoplasmatota archaeon]MCL5667869.1 hypothetical protein [Candidatus Thermoplasmatota archaeon]